MLDQLFKAIDGKDSAGFSAFLAEDCTFRFGNLPEVTGRNNIEEFVGAFFESINALSHNIHDHWEVPDAVICHGIVSYTRKDGSTLTVPFSNILKMSADRINQYFIFIDTSELYQQ